MNWMQQRQITSGRFAFTPIRVFSVYWEGFVNAGTRLDLHIDVQACVLCMLLGMHALAEGDCATM